MSFVVPLSMSTDRARARRSLQLQSATTMLAAALTEEAVAGALLSVTEEILQATAGVVYLQDADGRLRLAASRGVSHSLEPLRILPLDASLPLSTAVRERCPIYVSRREELLAQYPTLANTQMASSHLQAVAAIPLIQGGNLVGGFAVSFDSDQDFDAEERRWLEAIAAQASVAADRARLYEAERRAREEAETLYRISDALIATQTDLETVVQRVTDEATKMTGAEFGAFFYNVLNAKGESYLLYTLSGAPKEAFAKFGLPRNTPIFAATFSGQGIVRLDDVKKDPRYGQMAPHHGMPKGHLPVTSYLAVPVIARSGEVLGGLFFGHSQPARFTAVHERVTKALAASAALAIENANLLKASREAETQQNAHRGGPARDGSLQRPVRRRAGARSAYAAGGDPRHGRALEGPPAGTGRPKRQADRQAPHQRPAHDPDDRSAARLHPPPVRRRHDAGAAPDGPRPARSPARRRDGGRQPGAGRSRSRSPAS